MIRSSFSAGRLQANSVLFRNVALLDLTIEPRAPLESPCEICAAALKVPTDRVSIQRTCPDCGKTRFETSTSPGAAVSVRKGEKIIIPADVLTTNFRFSGGAVFTQTGVDWMARQLFGFHATEDLGHAFSFLAGWATLAERLLSEDPAAGLVEQDDTAALSQYLNDCPESNLLPCLRLHGENDSLKRDVLAAEPAAQALVLRMFRICVSQAMLAFRYAAEEACFRGNSLERLRRLTDEITSNLDNDDERFWQALLLENSLAISQIFSAPCVIHGDNFYIGGIQGGGRHAKYADIVLRRALTQTAVIVEIKTPRSDLLRKTPYRQGVFSPSAELTGAVQQVLSQRDQFLMHLHSSQGDLEDQSRLVGLLPECLVVVGNAKQQLNTRERCRAYDGYRQELRTVRILTVDELLERLYGILELLGTPARPSTDSDDG